MSAVIEVRGLHKRYGDHIALERIDFSIARGEVVGFLGPNGAGKTSTMKILTGYISPSGGASSVMGVDVVGDPVTVRKRLGYLPEASPVYPEMRVFEYLDFVGRVRGLERSERAAALDRAMARTGLTPRRNQTIGTLSKGYRQRVGLAQAILHEPDLLILDEPTSGLDPNQIHDIRELIRELGRTKTVLLSTHILSEVQATCDRVIIINKGKVVADGPTEEITSRGMGDRLHLTLAPGEVTLSRAQVLEALRAVPGVDDVIAVATAEGADDELALQLRASEDVRAALFREVVSLGMVLLEMHQERSNLEEVFRRLTQG
jgi:ABC-2 type transport system ATP-binding protein